MVNSKQVRKVRWVRMKEHERKGICVTMKNLMSMGGGWDEEMRHEGEMYADEEIKAQERSAGKKKTREEGEVDDDTILKPMIRVRIVWGKVEDHEVGELYAFSFLNKY